MSARPEQVGHGALRVPLPVEPPLAARVDEPVGGHGRQDEIPAGALAGGLEALGPEAVQRHPPVAREPAGPPLAGAPHAQLLQPDLHHRGVGDRWQPVLRNQGDGAGRQEASLEHLEGLAPGLALAVVDLAEVEHGPLHPAPGGQTAALPKAPVPMLLAVLLAHMAAEKHGAAPLPLTLAGGKRVGLHYRPDSEWRGA